MKYPQKLIDEVEKRSQGFNLEGINEGAGPTKPILMIVGEAPGQEEIKSHVPFCGASGKELMKSLASIGLKREDVYITSAVRSRPYSVKKVFSKKENKKVVKYPNRKPTKKEILAHAPFLDYEISNVKPKIIIPVGNTAMERLLGPGHLVSKEHGQIIKSKILELNDKKDNYQWSDKEYLLIPQYHPAAIFYNRKLTDIVKKDWLGVKLYIEE